MRYGIFSDVHGNLEALTGVLLRLSELQVDRYIFLGDAVGYGANPNEVCDIIRGITSVNIVGNHDAAVSGRMDYSQYYDAARASLDWCRARMTPENHQWLCEMPYKVREESVEFSHGSPVLPEQFDYLFDTEQVLDLLPEFESLAPVTFIGHSHLPVSFRITREAVIPLHLPQIICDAEDKYVITVGSVGQPRDRDPRACCGVFDTETRMFEYQRIAYDTHGTRDKIIAAGLPPIFGERLLVGL